VTSVRVYNIWEGQERKYDTLPYELMQEETPEGSQKGFINSQEELDIILDDYYTLHD
jgi:hypothetical protein